MQDLHVLREHLERITRELMAAKNFVLSLETIDKEKTERAWNELISASEEVSQKWEGPSVVKEIKLQREKEW